MATKTTITEFIELYPELKNVDKELKLLAYEFYQEEEKLNINDFLKTFEYGE